MRYITIASCGGSAYKSSDIIIFYHFHNSPKLMVSAFIKNTTGTSIFIGNGVLYSYFLLALLLFGEIAGSIANFSTVS